VREVLPHGAHYGTRDSSAAYMEAMDLAYDPPMELAVVQGAEGKRKGGYWVFSSFVEGLCRNDLLMRIRSYQR
jgi:hypothetical protein